MAAAEAERMMNESSFDNVGEIQDVVTTLTRIAKEIHPEIMRAYPDDPSKRSFHVLLLLVCTAWPNRGDSTPLRCLLTLTILQLFANARDDRARLTLAESPW